MHKKILKFFAVIFFCFLFSAAVGTSAQNADNSVSFRSSQLKINSVKENIFLGTSVLVKGNSAPNVTISLSIKNEKDAFTYSIETKSNAEGSWSANFDQSLKSGEYYIQAEQKDNNGFIIAQAKYSPMQIKGSFAFIVGIFSILVIILLAAFLSGWYVSKLAEIKRYRRILISQRDIIATHNVLKNDVSKALKTLGEEKQQDQRINEAEFFLKRINENLGKMDKYVLQGVNTIGNYDIIRKIDNILKLNFKNNK